MALDLTKQQTKSLIAAWLGWAFDGLDGFLYVLVGFPFVTQLVAREHGTTVEQVRATDSLSGEVTFKATMIQAFFLIGWAIGGAVFGRLGDRLGRSRTLTLTVLTYACFTGLSFFAGAWWHLLIFRFVAALGIGGEWAAGSALVSETLPPRYRAWASATLQSGYMIGCIAAALTTTWLSRFEPRWVFLVGVVPAFATVWIRWAVPEPEQWRKQAATSTPPPVSALLSRELRRTTVLTILLTGIALTTVWAFWFFLPVAIRRLPEVRGWDRPQIEALVSSVTICSLSCNILGNYFATYLARFTTYRFAFAFLFAAGLACFLIGFAHPLTMRTVYLVPGITSFFILGVFGLFPLYVPTLFPTLLRTLGAGVTYNSGRLISAAGTAGTGWLMTQAGGPSGALWWVSLLYVPGIAVALMAPKPRYILDGRPERTG
jgi:MFS family permease